MNPPIKDYAVSVRIRNNYLLKAMSEAGIDSVAELARRAGIAAPPIYDCLTLKRTPLVPSRARSKEAFMINRTVAKIAEVLNKHPLDLFPPQHHEKPLKTNKIEVEMDLQQMLFLYEPPRNPEELYLQKENEEILPVLLEEMLSPREKEVIESRFGINGAPQTLEEVGSKLGVSMARVRQIEARSLRKLRHVCRKKRLREALGRDE